MGRFGCRVNRRDDSAQQSVPESTITLDGASGIEIIMASIGRNLCSGITANISKLSNVSLYCTDS